MQSDLLTSSRASTAKAWEASQSDLRLAQQQLRSVTGGHSRQLAYQALLESERRCTEFIHMWLAAALELEQVSNPTHVLSLDVDGVLEDESEGYSSTGLSGTAALKLMQLGRVAVLLNTARSLSAVKERVRQFKLLGGVAGFGAATWDDVFGRDRSLVGSPGDAELERLRETFQARDGFVLDTSHCQSVRVSQVVEGLPKPIIGVQARTLLDQLSLNAVTYWVAPRYTDFIDRSVDKAAGINSLRQDLGVDGLPLAAMGDAACDVPMFRLAKSVFLPAATLPSYVASRRQRLFRSHRLGEQALWEAACRMVPSQGLQKQVLSMASQLRLPPWFPKSLAKGPTSTGFLRPRLATMFPTVRQQDRNHEPPGDNIWK